RRAAPSRWRPAAARRPCAWRSLTAAPASRPSSGSWRSSASPGSTAARVVPGWACSWRAAWPGRWAATSRSTTGPTAVWSSGLPSVAVAEEQANGRYERVLVVSAHPDDPEFGFGGSVAKLAADGAEVCYVICTDGSQGGEDP